jgi:hypothetical protein
VGPERCERRGQGREQGLCARNGPPGSDTPRLTRRAGVEEALYTPESAGVKEALHVKAQRGGPQALREREVTGCGSAALTKHDALSASRRMHILDVPTHAHS